MNAELRRALAVYDRRRELEARDANVVWRATQLAVAAGDTGNELEPTPVREALAEMGRAKPAIQSAAQAARNLAAIRAGHR